MVGAAVVRAAVVGAAVVVRIVTAQFKILGLSNNSNLKNQLIRKRN